MKCITSPALDNVEIATYVDGEAEEAVIAHIQQCPFCSEKARQWTLLLSSLRKQSYRIDCPTPMELGDYHLVLPPPFKLLVVSSLLRKVLFGGKELPTWKIFWEPWLRKIACW